MDSDMDYERTPAVLIIDNDEGLLSAIATRIESLGYRCVTARTGAQGLDEFRSDDIDLVITDMNMPVLDGAGVIEQIRKTRDTPIIVVTGFKDEYTPLIKSMHEVQVIEKPFSSQDLIDVVETEIFLRRSTAA